MCILERIAKHFKISDKALFLLQHAQCQTFKFINIPSGFSYMYIHKTLRHCNCAIELITDKNSVWQATKVTERFRILWNALS